MNKISARGQCLPRVEQRQRLSITSNTRVKNMHVNWMRSVGFLTDVAAKRHLADFVSVMLLLPIMLLSAGAQGADTRWQPIREITSAAENYLKLSVGLSDERIVPTAGHLDPRLQLPLCDETLDPYLRPGTKVSGRTIVGVRCPGSKPWKVYIPVYVAVMEQVLVAKSSMPKGHLIQREDIEMATRDISGLLAGYLSQTGQVVGHRLKRGVTRGVVFIPSLLQVETLIKRGQSVVLTVNNDTLDIRMPGKALMDGARNQRIKVENTRSGRVVEGLVRSAERVEVLIN